MDWKPHATTIWASLALTFSDFAYRETCQAPWLSSFSPAAGAVCTDTWAVVISDGNGGKYIVNDHSEAHENRLNMGCIPLQAFKLRLHLSSWRTEFKFLWKQSPVMRKIDGLVLEDAGSYVSMDWFCWENLNRKPSIFPLFIWGFPVKIFPYST